MAKLVIVESPAKAKTIGKYLGDDYEVTASMGHIRDLPASQLGIDIEHDYAPQYISIKGKEKLIKELKSKAKHADGVLLATDPDREGEAISWHLANILGLDPHEPNRVTFDEITKKGVKEGMAHPRAIDEDLFNAQQARRVLDRLVGYKLSPFLWRKVRRGLSAGRVQSVAVRLIDDREKEIESFKPDEYWNVDATLGAGHKSFTARLATDASGKKLLPKSEAEARAIEKGLEGAEYVVAELKKGKRAKQPTPAFITSTLQQEASRRLGFTATRTMRAAQTLYEGVDIAGHGTMGLITYMRTDSTNLSKEAVEAVREYIGEQYGAAYLPSDPNLYGAKANAQEAHEAIRPSSVQVTAEMLEGMEPDAMRLYDLIWRQFVACQMTPAQYDSSTLTVKAGEFELKARGRTLRFAGWTKALPPMGRKGEDSQLPAVTVGEVLKLVKLDPRQHFTKPPARFTEAALVRELEKRGIGRPSTYASIISTIVDRGYVRVESRRFFAEKMGEIVTDRLVENFVELMNYEFTAKMEDKLDGIAEGSLEWKKVLDAFYAEFTQELEKADKAPEEGGMRANQMVLTDIDCPDCGRKMGIRTATTGVFLGCSGYALPPKERCKKTINLVSADEFVSATDGEEAETEALRAKHRCIICGTAMDAYIIDDSRKLHVCGRNPDCDGYEIEKGQFKLKGYEGPSIECDRCGSEMQLKNGRFGKYMGCTNDTCKNTRKILKNGDIAPPKEDPVPLPELKCTQSDAHFVLRDGAAGLFLAASNFPKSRETRAPLVEELKRFKERLSPKHQYLADAPASDPDGNPAIVRFSRKTKEQYVMTEVNGKATGWTAHYDNGKWQESLAKSKKA